jgi:hypothetical protein
VASEKRFSKMFHPGSFWFIGPLLVIGDVARAGRAGTIHMYLIKKVVAQNPVARTKKAGKSFAAALDQLNNRSTWDRTGAN